MEGTLKRKYSEPLTTCSKKPKEGDLMEELLHLRQERARWIEREKELLSRIEELEKRSEWERNKDASNSRVFGRILELPRDVVLYRIFSYLRTVRDQLRLRQVCKRWKTLIEGWIPKLDCEPFREFFTDFALKGLSNCVNLTSLNMRNCRFLTHHSFEYLIHLTSLTELTVPPNILGRPAKENAVLQLSRLTNLKSLRLVDAGVKDLDNLSRLKNLTSLDLTGNNPIDSFNTMSKLSMLRSLDISHTRPSAVTFKNVELLPSLRHLYLKDCSGIKVTILKHLSRLTMLETLFVKVDKDKSIGKKAFQHIGKMVNLVTLGIMCRGVPVEGIEQMTKLRVLILRGEGWNLEPVTKIGTLSKLTNLIKLSVNCGLLAMDQFQQVSTLTNLEELTLSKPANSTHGQFKGVENLSQLKSLHIERFFATSAALQSMRHLRSLSIIQGFNHDALSQICTLTELEILFLDGTENVGDKEIKPLTQLPKLRELSLSRTAITDEGILSLAGFSTLEKFFAAGCKLTNRCISSFVTMTRLRILNLVGCTGISDVGLLPLDKLPNLEHLCKPTHSNYTIPKVDDW